MANPCVAVVGLGAVGWSLAARLARGAGCRVTLYTRAESLRRLQGGDVVHVDGAALRLREAFANVRAWDERGLCLRSLAGEPAEAQPPKHDVVFVCVKANALHDTSGGLAAAARGLLRGEESSLVLAQNGIPYWFPLADAGASPAAAAAPPVPADLPALHTAALAEHLPLNCVVAAVLYLVAWFPDAAGEDGVGAAPVVTVQSDIKRIVLGAPLAQGRGKAEAVAAVLRGAGLAPAQTPVADDIRMEVWLKLLGNCSFNPLSVLLGQTLGEMAGDEETLDVVRKIMTEATAVGTAIGLTFPMTVDERIRVSRAAASGSAGFKPSMLQDFEAGRPLETEALLDTLAAIARAVGVPCPTIDVVAALVKAKARKPMGRDDGRA